MKMPGRGSWRENHPLPGTESGPGRTYYLLHQIRDQDVLHDPLPPPVWPRMTQAEVDRLPASRRAEYAESMEWTDERRTNWWRKRQRLQIRVTIIFAAAMAGMAAFTLMTLLVRAISR